MSNVVTLEQHLGECETRYQGVMDKLDCVDDRLHKVEEQLSRSEEHTSELQSH